MKKRFYIFIVVGILFLITLFICPNRNEHSAVMVTIEIETLELDYSNDIAIFRESLGYSYIV